MKKIFFALVGLIMLIGTASAQDGFSGMIKFDIKYMGEGVDQMAAFMPTANIYKFQGTSMKFNMEGGMMSSMMGTMMVKTEKKKPTLYVIKDAEQKAYKIPVDDNEEEEEEDKPNVIVQKLDETVKIAGYSCQKYEVVTTVEGEEGPETITQYIWATKEISIERPKGSKKMKGGGNLFVEGVDGFPLKMMSTMDMMGMQITMIQTANTVEEKKFEKAEFEVPKNYTVEETTFEELFGGMMGGAGGN